MIKNNLDGFASKLQAINTTAFSDKWLHLGGNRTYLTNAIQLCLTLQNFITTDKEKAVL
jgi:hypothetical protein